VFNRTESWSYVLEQQIPARKEQKWPQHDPRWIYRCINQQEQYTTTRTERKFSKDICVFFHKFNWHREHILCGLILLKANLNDRITQRGKPYIAGTKWLRTGQLTYYPNALTIRQFKIIDRLHFQDLVSCSMFWCIPTWKANKFL